MPLNRTGQGFKTLYSTMKGSVQMQKSPQTYHLKTTVKAEIY